MSMTSSVVFDLDGTLVNTIEIVQSVLNDMRRSKGLGDLSTDEIVPWLSVGGETMIQELLELNSAETPRFTQEFRRLYKECPTPSDFIFPGVENVLDKLKNLGVSLHVCTNKPRELALIALDEAGIKKYFSSICAGDDLTTRKPDQANFYECFGGQSISPNNSIMIGDSVVDQQLASNAGVRFGFFRSGYDDGVNITITDFSFGAYSDFPFGQI